jgi:hypothetical protein
MDAYLKLKQLYPETYREAIQTAEGIIFTLHNGDSKYTQNAIIEKAIVNYTLYLLEKK